MLLELMRSGKLFLAEHGRAPRRSPEPKPGGPGGFHCVSGLSSSSPSPFQDSVQIFAVNFSGILEVAEL